MFGWNKGKPSLFYKYFFSYIIIFLIPFIIISAIFYYNSVNNLRNEIIQSNLNKLKQVRNMTDLRMKEIENIATRMSFDPRLTRYMVSKPYSGKQAVEELKRYKANSSIIDDLILYYRGENYVHSPKGVASLNTLVKDAYPFNEEQFTEFKDFMDTLTYPTVLPIDFVAGDEGAHQRLIAYMYPVPSYTSAAYGSVVFFLKEQILTDLIYDILGDLNGNVYIFNASHEVLTSNNKGAALSPEEIVQLAVSHPGVDNKKLNNQDYSVITVHSETSGWSFVTAMPTAQYYAKVADFQTFILIILAVIALVGLGSAIYLASRQYRPIHNLVQFLRSKQNQVLPEQLKKIDFATLRHHIEDMLEDSEQLREKMNVQQPLVRDQCLTQLLKGAVTDRQEMNGFLQDFQIKMDGKYFFVAIYTFTQDQGKAQSFENRENILETLTHISFAEGVAYGLELIQDNAVAIIVNIEGNDPPYNIQRSFADKLIQQLKEHGLTLPTIGVGCIYEGMGFINRSFIEARAAIEHTLTHKRGRAIFFDEIAEQEGEAFWYPADKRLKFIQSLKQGDQDVAQETLREIMDSLTVNKPSVYMLRCMCFDIVNTVLKTALELGLTHYANDIKMLIEFRSTEELERSIKAVIADICSEVERNKESTNHELRDDIMVYIHKQYKLHDLSLKKISDEFQISVSYLSRFIKEQTGSSFTELVWQLRLEEAKRQLQETDRSIKSIVKDLGYVDVANFTRKFRLTEGITPGQFRDQCQNL